MPAQRTPRREALAGAGTTASLLAATIGGALVVAGLLGVGVFPGGPDDGSATPLHIAAPAAGERTASIVLPSAPAPRAARRHAARAPLAAERPRVASPHAASPSTSPRRAPCSRRARPSQARSAPRAMPRPARSAPRGTPRWTLLTRPAPVSLP
jgi:hypothetical protein